MGMQPRHAASIAHSIFGVRSGEDTGESNGQFEECKVHHINSDGLYFTRPMYDKNVTVYGPAPYTWPLAGVTEFDTGLTHTHALDIPATAPVKGDRVLIAWVASFEGGMRPWVLGWDAS